MSRATKVSISVADPGYTRDDGSVTKTVVNQAVGDKVVVSAWESGLNPSTRDAVVVLKISTGGTPTATVDAAGKVLLTASDQGSVRYMASELGASDPNNWTVYVKTSGGSEFKYVKGTGGSGRK